jgi:dienelactone hydrolase
MLARRLLVILLIVVALPALAATPRALPDGKLPSDVRLNPPKDLNGYFPFTPPKSADEWRNRAEKLRRQLLVSQGLWPQPTKTPLNAVIHGKVERDDFTVERVYFESMPGFYVTGNLYRPKGKQGKLPGVLRPDGHWTNARFMDKGRQAVRQEIVQGAERFEDGGRNNLQAMNVQLARMGCVVFQWDMLGNSDSHQISFDLTHRFGKQRPEMNTTENWGLYSPQAEAHLQSIMGLQTWNSIRALDFITSLPDVDPNRIGVTGASGGGTQTFMVCAVDPRPTVSMPAVMVSTAMQGGCTCENASCLRVNTGNIEFAALFAPKPQGFTAADDWTKEMATKGFPELQKHYELLGAKANTMLAPLLHFGHNYNYPSRAAMYSWFNKHLKLGLEEPVVEEDHKRLPQEEVTVWDAEHPKPEGGPEFEKKLLKWWNDDARQQIPAPKDADSLAKYREIVGGALEAILARSLPTADEVEYQNTGKTEQGKHLVMTGLVRNKRYGEELPIVVLHPQEANGRALIWLDDAGKAGLFTSGGDLKPEVQKLVDAGTSIVGVDLFMQGEYLADGKPPEANRQVGGNRDFAGYTYGYNSPLFAQRVHDVLTAVVFCANYKVKPETIDIVALSPQAGPIAAVARGAASGLVRRAAIDTHGFRFGKLLDYRDVMFLPGGAKYGDVPGFLALAGGEELWLAGEGEGNDLLKSAFAAKKAGDKLAIDKGDDAGRAARALVWVAK